MAGIVSFLLQARQTSDPTTPESDPTQEGGGGNGGADEFLKLIQDPFKSVFQENAFWAALGTSFGVAAATTLLFSLLRPRNRTVYAPKLKFADPKHAPPAIGNGLFAWVKPVLKSREPFLAERIGLDATIFLRFTRMCRNMFLVMSIIGLAVLVPANVAGRPKGQDAGYSKLTLITPLLVWGGPLWAQVVCSWVFDALIAGFLWWNYRIVVKLRRAYFDTPEYQNTLHARTLMLTELPKLYQTDEGIERVIEEVRQTPRPLSSSIARNVKELPKLTKQHNEINAELESYIIKYINKARKNPNARRPTCSPSKDDHTYTKGHKVDAIDYLADRKIALKYDIMAIRETLSKRDAMPYGFASYDTIPEAHAVAYSARRKHPQGTNIALAPTPKDIIWSNLPMGKKERHWAWFTNTLWVALLTIVYIVPNALMAVFLTNLSNLGNVWPAFQRSLEAHPQWWALVQGVASPAITSLLYVLLPMCFRRLATRAGEVTKTARDQQVVHQLFAFFVFNNLVVFTAFSTVWALVAAVVSAGKGHENLWSTIKQSHIGGNLAAALCNTSPYWVTWLLQRNLGAAVDLSQIWNLLWIFFSKKFMSPTPRQLIQWTRPPSFDYVSYYNYFLFYATVTLCFATLQPIVLLVTALYFSYDSLLKKYLLMYVFVTKTESGGQFWRVLYNRLVFAAIIANITVLIFVTTKQEYVMAWSILPAPFAMLGFKWYCWRTFDDKMNYYTRNVSDSDGLVAAPHKHRVRHDKLGFRFGHPALTEPLPNPLIKEADAQAFHDVTRNRFLDDTTPGAPGSIPGQYDESIQMRDMSRPKQGQAANFELVPEGHLDFLYYRDRPEFADEHGGGGEIYGRPVDLISDRPDTPASFMTGTRDGSPYGRGRTPFDSHPGSRASSPSVGPYSRVPTYKEDEAGPGVGAGGYGPAYPGGSADYRNHPAFRPAPGQQQQQQYPSQSQSGSRSRSRGAGAGGNGMGYPDYAGSGDLGGARGIYPTHTNESESALLRSAAGMPREDSAERGFRTNAGMYGPGPAGYGGVPGQDPMDDNEGMASYEHYRGRRR
ncbi:MAG: hypothetical protein M4579_006758 [Chaenotheca gracillima]|nr:MAG: hypothetical protein M4579_006758 [Chaenotheca gracillima]